MTTYNYNEGFNVKKVVASVAVLLLIVYGVFNARKLIEGPQIEVFEPTNGVEMRSNPISIKGVAKNITFLSLNEKPIAIDTAGIFEEKLLLSPGYNTIRIYAKDRFKQDTVKEIKIYYNDNHQSTTTDISMISKDKN
jgi:hypothetical protein